MNTEYKPLKAVFPYVGSKRRIIDTILDTFPIEMYDYHETFLGSGSVLLGVLNRCEEKRIKINNKIYCSDLNPFVIHTFKMIKNNASFLISQLKSIINHFNSLNKEQQKSFFYEKRDQLNQLVIDFDDLDFKNQNKFKHNSDEIWITEVAVLYIFLMKLNYRSLARYTDKWTMKTSFGYKTKINIDFNNIINMSTLFHRYKVDFYRIPYKQAIFLINDVNSFLYCDPPYCKVHDTTFNQYVGDFNDDDSIELFNTIKESGCKHAMSNYDCSLVNEHFNDYNCKSFYLQHCLSKNKSVNEIIVYN